MSYIVLKKWHMVVLVSYCVVSVSCIHICASLLFSHAYMLTSSGREILSSFKCSTTLPCNPNSLIHYTLISYAFSNGKKKSFMDAPSLSCFLSYFYLNQEKPTDYKRKGKSFDNFSNYVVSSVISYCRIFIGQESGSAILGKGVRLHASSWCIHSNVFHNNNLGSNLILFILPPFISLYFLFPIRKSQ